GVDERAIGTGVRSQRLAGGAQAATETHKVRGFGYRGVVLNLNVAADAVGVLPAAATTGEDALHDQRRRIRKRCLVGIGALILEAGFIDDLRVEGLGVGDLDSVFIASRVGRGSLQRIGADATVLRGAAFILIADGQHVLRANSKVQPRCNVLADLRLKNGSRRHRERETVAGQVARVAQRSRRSRRSKKAGRIDDRVLLNAAARSADAERRVLRQRAGHVAEHEEGVVAGMLTAATEERVGGVERFGVALGAERAVELVGAGLGEDLDAAVTELVVLRRERVLVDADFADRRLGRKLAAGEAVDVNLSAVGACGWAGESGKLRGKFIGIVRQRLEV